MSIYFAKPTRQAGSSMRYVVYTLLVVVGMASVAQAQVAYIHQDSILQNLPGYTAAVQAVSAKQQAYTAEVDQRTQILESKIKGLVDSYQMAAGESIQNLKNRMSAADTLELNLLLAEEKMIQQKTRVYTTILQQKYATEVQPLLDMLNATLAAYAKEHKLNAIYILEEVYEEMAYVSEKSIITKQIIDLVNAKKRK